ncbi:MAG: D-aminoacyl-tRNA deacylase [Fimbriimonas sp.]
MRAIVQRVLWSKVVVDSQIVGKSPKGFLLLVAVHRADMEADARKLAEKILNLRIFNDSEGKMNLSILQLANGDEPVGILAVSNFTVYGEATGRRPSFTNSAPYERGKELFKVFLDALRLSPIPIETGVFGADMEVTLANDGPVTVIVEAGPTEV